MTKLSIEQRFGVACAVSVAGGLVALSLMVIERHIELDFGIFRVALGGAFFAGLALADGFGRNGVKGFLIATLAFGAATIAGAIFAVWLMPLDGVWSMSPAAFMRPNEVLQTGLLGPLYLIDIALREATLSTVLMLVGALVHAIAINLRTDRSFA